ncbi:MAG: hypothetical protein AAGI11_06025 [Pseudomonadota bacterium]
MTQHILEEHTLEDQRTMKRLGIVIAIFVLATAVMATAISFIL